MTTLPGSGPAVLFCLLLSVAFLSAADKPRDAVDFTQHLQGIDGKPLVSDASKQVMTLSDIACGALWATLDQDRGEPNAGEAKWKRDDLCRRVLDNKAAKLSVEDLSMLKKRIGEAWSAQIVGITWRLIDPSLAEEKGQ